MKRVPATHFIKNIGTFLRGHGGETVVVTAHGTDGAVLLSQAAYRRLLAQADAAHAKPARPHPGKDPDPLTTALSIVSTSIPFEVSKTDLIGAIKGRKDRRHIADIFFADVGPGTMAGLVNEGYFGWRDLQAAAGRSKRIDDEKASFIRGMVEFELAAAARPRARAARRRAV